MKNISFKIPTSVSDVKTMWKERADRRHKHNMAVVTQMYKTMLDNMKSGYWNKDVSEYFRENFQESDYKSNGCKGLLAKTLKELQ